MAEYRAYAVGVDGHFVGFEPIIYDDDNAAVERAERLLGDRDIEVWCGDRLVAQLPHK
jgi:hypothetical protein